MRTTIALLFIAVGLAQMLAIAAGLEAAQGISLPVGASVALLLAHIPVAGTVAGIVGAVVAWQWSWLASIAAFVVPMALIVIAARAMHYTALAAQMAPVADSLQTAA